MTVQELINKLQQIENKSAIIARYDAKWGNYDKIEKIYYCSIPQTMNSFDEGDESIPQIDVVLI